LEKRNKKAELQAAVRRARADAANLRELVEQARAKRLERERRESQA
jgi:hypothetical protein